MSFLGAGQLPGRRWARQPLPGYGLPLQTAPPQYERNSTRCPAQYHNKQSKAHHTLNTQTDFTKARFNVTCGSVSQLRQIVSPEFALGHAPLHGQVSTVSHLGFLHFAKGRFRLQPLPSAELRNILG